jgi:hypothetical protein
LWWAKAAGANFRDKADEGNVSADSLGKPYLIKMIAVSVPRSSLFWHFIVPMFS